MGQGSQDAGTDGNKVSLAIFFDGLVRTVKPQGKGVPSRLANEPGTSEQVGVTSRSSWFRSMVA